MDAEYDSGKIQVQSGSGKNGYDLNIDVRISDIKSKEDIIDWVASRKELKNIKSSELKKIINAMWNAYKSFQ